MRLDRTISDELVNLGYMPELRKLYRGEGSLDIISSDGKTLYKISGDLDNPVFKAYALLPDGVVDAQVNLPPEDISLALKNQLGKGQVLGFEQAEDKMMSFAMAKKPAQSMFDSAMDTAFDSPMEVVRLQELSKAKEAAQSNIRDLAARQKMVEGRPLPPDFFPTTNRVSDEEFQAGLERVRQEGYDGSPAGGQTAINKYTEDMGRNLLRNPEYDPRLQRMVDLGQMGALPGQEAVPSRFPSSAAELEAPSQLEGAAELAAQLQVAQPTTAPATIEFDDFLDPQKPWGEAVANLYEQQKRQETGLPTGQAAGQRFLEATGRPPSKRVEPIDPASRIDDREITPDALFGREVADLYDAQQRQQIQEAGLTTHAAGKNFLAATERGPQKTVVDSAGFVFEIDETRGGYTVIGKQENDGTIQKMVPKYFEPGSKAAQTLDQQRLDQAEAGPPSLPPPTPTNPDDRPDAYSPMFSVDKPQAEAPAVEKTPKQREKLNDAQKMGALYGTMLGLEIIGQTAAALSPARKYARQEEKRLENLAQRGQLGLTEGEKSEIRSAYARPVKAMASEARKRQESTLAATGANLSAAELARRRKEESQTVQRALSDAAATITQADMQKAQQQLAKLEGLKEYRTQAQQQAAGSIIGTVATGAKALGDVFATQARAEDPTSAIQSLAREYSMQNSEMTMDDAYKLAELEIKRRLEEDKKKQGGPTSSYGMTGAQIAGTYIGS